MRTIKWIGAVLAAAGTAVVIALTSGAAVADVIVERSSGQLALTPGQVSALQSWVVSVWPGAPESDVDAMTCQRHADDPNDVAVVLCSAYRTSLLTAAQFAEAEANGSAVGVPDPESIASDGSTILARLRIGKKKLSPGQVSSLASGAATVFGIPAATMRQVSFRKVGAVVFGEAKYLDTLTPVQRLLCRRAKSCGRLVGTIE